MNDDRDIQELERWLDEFPDPRPSDECLQRVRSAVSVALADTSLAEAPLPSAAGQRVKQAVHVELRAMHAARWRRRVLAWSGAVAAAAAVVVLLVARSAEVSIDPGVEDEPLRIATITDDPEAAELEAELEDLELRTAALDLSADHPEDRETLRILESLAAPDYLMDFEDLSL